MVSEVALAWTGAAEKRWTASAVSAEDPTLTTTACVRTARFVRALVEDIMVFSRDKSAEAGAAVPSWTAASAAAGDEDEGEDKDGADEDAEEDDAGEEVATTD